MELPYFLSDYTCNWKFLDCPNIACVPAIMCLSQTRKLKCNDYCFKEWKVQSKCEKFIVTIHNAKKILKSLYGKWFIFCLDGMIWTVWILLFCPLTSYKLITRSLFILETFPSSFLFSSRWKHWDALLIFEKVTRINESLYMN